MTNTFTAPTEGGLKPAWHLEQCTTCGNGITRLARGRWTHVSDFLRRDAHHTAPTDNANPLAGTVSA